MRKTRKMTFFSMTFILSLLCIWGITSNIIGQRYENRIIEESNDYSFDISGEFIYDPSEISISESLAKLKDLRPIGAIFYCNYDSEIDATWGNGDLIGVGIGGPAIVGGELDLSGDTVTYVDYNVDSNADMQQTGAIRFSYTPDYAGSPTNHQYILYISKSSTSNINRISLEHRTNTGIYLYIYDYLGTTKISVNFGSWNPTLGQSYEFELNFDVNNGGSGTRLFIDGGQHGSTNMNYFIRSSDIGFFRIGSNNAGTYASDYYIDDLILFDEVKHNSSYSIGESISDIIYEISDPTIELKTGFNFDTEFTKFEIDSIIPAETDIRFIVSSNDGLSWKYWTGSEWSISDESYTQANIGGDINLYINQLAGSGYFRFKVFLHSENGMKTAILNSISIIHEDTILIDISNETVFWMTLGIVGMGGCIFLFVYVKGRYKIDVDIDVKKRKSQKRTVKPRTKRN